MMPTEGLPKYPYPPETNDPDVPADILSLAERLVRMNGAGIGYSATTAARNAKVTAEDVYLGYFDWDAEAQALFRWTSHGWERCFIEGAAVPFTPTWVNFTVGNGTVTATYWIENGWLHVKVAVTAGSTSQITGPNPRPNYPIPIDASRVNNSSIGKLGYFTSAGFVTGEVWYLYGNINVFYQDTAALLQTLNSTAPKPLATTEMLAWDFRAPLA
jgi:hypothetical protein